MVLLPLIVLVLDQGLKFSLQDAYLNTGVAFGVGSSWLVGIGLILLVWLGRQYRWQPRFIWVTLAIAFISNLIDRIRLGGIIDYLQLGSLHFNLADVVIVTCIVLLLSRYKDILTH